MNPARVSIVTVLFLTLAAGCSFVPAGTSQQGISGVYQVRIAQEGAEIVAVVSLNHSVWNPIAENHGGQVPGELFLWLHPMGPDRLLVQEPQQQSRRYQSSTVPIDEPSDWDDPYYQDDPSYQYETGAEWNGLYHPFPMGQYINPMIPGARVDIPEGFFSDGESEVEIRVNIQELALEPDVPHITPFHLDGGDLYGIGDLTGVEVLVSDGFESNWYYYGESFVLDLDPSYGEFINSRGSKAYGFPYSYPKAIGLSEIVGLSQGDFELPLLVEEGAK